MTEITFQRLADRISYMGDRTMYPDIPILSVVEHPPSRSPVAMPDSLALANMLTRALQREAPDRPNYANITRLNVHAKPAFFTRLVEALHAAQATVGFNTAEPSAASAEPETGRLANIVGTLDHEAYGLPAYIRTGDTVMLDDLEEDTGYDAVMWGVTLRTQDHVGESWLIPLSNLEVIP